jgi:alanine dehydrogenase
MLLIDNAMQAGLIAVPDCIAVLEKAFLGLATGRSIIRPKTDLLYPASRPDGYFRFGSMEGAHDGVCALRIIAEIAAWERRPDGTMREEQYCVAPGTYLGLVLLFSTDTGAPLAILNDGHIQHVRVGASAGLGAKYLARADARTVGLIGAGGMARTCLEAFCAVRPIERATIYSPTAANREVAAAELGARLGIDVVAVASAREAVAGADIVATCTNAMAPVFEADWLEPGTHVTCVGTQEISRAAEARFDVKIRQGVATIAPARETARNRSDLGLSYAAYVGGTEAEMARLPAGGAHRLDTGTYPEFVDLATGRVPGRTRPGEITFYYNHGNQGLQFAAAGGLIYRNAKARGIGTELPDAWFLEDIKA